jgi:adenosine deaminase
MKKTDLKHLMSTPSGVFSAAKVYVLICFIGLVGFGIPLWGNADKIFVFSAGDYIYPILMIICGAICILTLSVQTRLAREEYSRIYPLASFGSNTGGNLMINLFFVFASVIPIMFILLPFSYSDPISLILSIAAFLVYVLLLKITYRNTIALGQFVSGLMVFCYLAQQTLVEIASGQILLPWGIIAAVWIGCVVWDLLSKKIYPPKAKSESFGINDAKFIIRMYEIRNWQGYCPAFNRDDLWDLLDRFDRFVSEGSHFRKNRLIWLVHVFYKPIDSQLDLETYMMHLKKNPKRLDRVYNFFLIFAAMFPPLLMFILPWRTVPDLNTPDDEAYKHASDLIVRAQRRSKIELSDKGHIVGFTYRNGHPMLASVVGESYLFSLPEVFFEDIWDLEQLIERDERLETTGLIYCQGSFAEELIMISNLEEEYENRCKIVQLKVLGKLVEENPITDARFIFDDRNKLFPQFNPELRQSPQNEAIIGWLSENNIKRDCPKTSKFLDSLRFSELHLHIGGVLSVQSQIDVGLSIWNNLNEAEKETAMNFTTEIRGQIQASTEQKSGLNADWNKTLANLRSKPRERASYAAAILFQFKDEQDFLLHALFPSWKNRWTDRLGKTGDRFAGSSNYSGYSTPGELMGSTLLCFDHESVVESYAQGVVKSAMAQQLRYLEIRMSPTKYRENVSKQRDFVKDFARSMNHAITESGIMLEYRILISLDRSKFSSPDGELELFFENFKGLMKLLTSDTSTRAVVAGYDIAGRENDDDIPGELMKRFIDMNLEFGLKTTFHAGEQADASNLRSAYQIHTERVGHALRLIEYPALLDAYVKSNICVEMCPTSNIEVHGYRTPSLEYYNFDGVYPLYPLKEYISAGLPVAICTDNPFISRTSMKNEIITASDLCLNEPLTFLDVLSIVFTGFRFAFIHNDMKLPLIEEVGQEIYNNLKVLVLESK